MGVGRRNGRSHSQFKNIMYRKGVQDKKRAKMFAKLAKEITVAAKMGLPDPEYNPRLRAAIQAARVENMPKDNIERAIKRQHRSGWRKLRGSALRGVRARWHRRHRRDADRQPQPDGRRSAGHFHQEWRQSGETSSVSFMFDRLGLIEYPAEAASADETIEAAIDSRAPTTASRVRKLARPLQRARRAA